MFKSMRVRFVLDGSGVFYDPYEPIMLDSLLAAAVCRWHVHGDPPARDEEPDEIPLPLMRWEIGGEWGWHASALFPVGPTAEGGRHWRKRFRIGRAELTTGSPNLGNGPWRNWNTQVPLLLAREMEAFAVGDIRQVRRELRRSIRFLGKKRAHGYGVVNDILVEDVDRDFSLTRDGHAMRWLPAADGMRLVRTRPPYWNSVGRVSCCEIGDMVLRDGSERMR